MNSIRRSQELNEKINQKNEAYKRGKISDSELELARENASDEMKSIVNEIDSMDENQKRNFLKLMSGSEPSFPLTVSTGDYETDAVVAYAIGNTTYEIQDSVMVGHFDANGKDTVRRIYLTKVDKGLEDIIAKFEWAGYALNVKEGYIEFINPDINQFGKLLDVIDENRYGNTAKETTNDAADVTFGTRRDRIAAYEAWLQSGKGDENRELRDFVRQAKERLEAESGGDGGNDGDSGNGGPHNADPKYLGQLLRESGMDNKTIKEVTPPHRGLLAWKETFDRKGHAILNIVAGEKHCVPVSTNDCLSAMC